MQFDAALYFPQWQGGPNAGHVAVGGHYLYEQLRKTLKLEGFAVDFSQTHQPEHGIWHYPAITANLAQARQWLAACAPRTLFTLGGDCSIDVASISHLHGVHGAHFGVIWIDAHADINTPASSPSQFFHGMPLRALLGEAPAGICQHIAHPLSPRQICYAGTRSIDGPEQDYISALKLPALTSAQVNRRDYSVCEAWLAQSGIRALHIHFDLDALDPSAGITTTYQIEGGIEAQAMADFLGWLHGRGITVGFSLTEYAPKAENAQEIGRILSLLQSILPLRDAQAA